MQANEKTNQFEVIIIGGSYAGLSAGLSLGRTLRKVLIIDAGMPCNKQTPYSHNFLTQDGVCPSDIAALGKAQVAKYGSVSFFNGLALQAQQQLDKFEITCDTGVRFYASKLILATGIKDIIPDIKGFPACWGKSVVHCPYCHGFEFRNKRAALYSSGEKAMHMASLLSHLNPQLTIIQDGKEAFTDTQMAALNRQNIEIINKEVAEFIHQDGALKTVLFQDNSQMDFEVLYATLDFVPHSDIAMQLGCDLYENNHIKIDSFQQTSIPGVYACGDNSSPMRSVANAVATGNLIGAMVNKALTGEVF
ncbi:MAG: NAD(P)/FAD-dependent oxidoreductase [Pedobacter sp.]|nr:MAG: NAD(P)/FAD-dependent oxidoreductase [Pedobacter sp.]